MYFKNDRVTKIANQPGEGTRFAPVGSVGTVQEIRVPNDTDRSDHCYICVRWDHGVEAMDSIEWCYESELVRAEAYQKFEEKFGRAPTRADCPEILNGIQLVDLERDDGKKCPSRHIYTDAEEHVVCMRPVGEIVGDGPVPEYVAVAYDPPGGVPGQRPDRIMVEDNGGLAWLQNPVAPTVPMPISDSEYRKMLPMGTVATEYFPLADQGRAAVAWVGNEKHNPGEHLHWSRGKSDDHVNCIHRHLQDMVSSDGWDTTVLPDGRVYQVRHAAAVAWRASAVAQLDAESVGGIVIRRLK